MKRFVKAISLLLASIALTSCVYNPTESEIKQIVDEHASEYGYILEDDVIDNLSTYFEKYGSSYGYYKKKPYDYSSYESGSVQTPKPVQQQTQSETVYITRTGSKYHKAGCSYLKSCIPISKSDAIAAGYTPCSRCY